MYVCDLPQEEIGEDSGIFAIRYIHYIISGVEISFTKVSFFNCITF
jgi:hypothetical protein